MPAGTTAVVAAGTGTGKAQALLHPHLRRHPSTPLAAAGGLESVRALGRPGRATALPDPGSKYLGRTRWLAHPRLAVGIPVLGRTDGRCSPYPRGIALGLFTGSGTAHAGAPYRRTAAPGGGRHCVHGQRPAAARPLPRTGC